MEPDVRIISLGALSANPVWGEKAPARAGHSTCTLVRAPAPGARASEPPRVILVDPGLPGDMLTARLAERVNLKPEAITHVFLTSFRPELRRGLGAFGHATWWIAEAEREAVGVPLAAAARRAIDADDAEMGEAIRQELALLQRCEPAPDHLGEGVDLFPLPGVTPGLCGLLIAAPRHTTLITGDAVCTRDHAQEGRLFSPAADVDAARASFEEALEIADVIIPGRDNLFISQTRGAF